MRPRETLKLDTSKIGIKAVFRPWQIEIVKILIEAHEEHSSNEIHQRLLYREFKISRASVINFLNGLAYANLISKREESTKGGFKGIYQINDTRHDFDDRIVKLFCLKMFEAFPTIEWLRDIWEEENA